MHKSTFSTRGLLAGVFVAVSFAQGAAAQTVASSATAGDPKSMLLAAAGANGAPGADAKPWHIKVSFTLNGIDGKTESQGTFEEFWAAPDKYKRIYATTDFNQVEYTTPSGARRTGNVDSVTPELERVTNAFLHPIAVDAASVETTQLKMQPVKSPNAKLVCVSAFRSGSTTTAGLNETYCLEENLPILRISFGGGGFSKTIRNEIVRFQGQYFPKAIEQILGGPEVKNPRRMLEAKLETLEAITPEDDALFTPPIDALPPPQVITLDEKTTKPQLVQHAPPVYPPIAKAARVSGNVVIALLIRTDGHVSHLHVLSGPPMLQQASLDAVRKWTFKPFQLNGKPVEVNTTATETFEIF